MTALRERLAQPQMQPCAGRNCGSTNPNLHSAECFEDYEKATGMAQPEPEPVAWIQPDHLQKARVAPFLCRVEPTQRCADFVPIYTAPPQRKPLTDESIVAMWHQPVLALAALEFARAIERAHGIGGG